MYSICWSCVGSRLSDRFSRRTFLSLATGVVATMLPRKTANAPLGHVTASGFEPLDCALLDAQQHCTLPESLAGYESALTTGGARFFRTSAEPLPYSKTIIVPACLALRPEMTQEVAAALKGGSLVVLESGASFATPSDFVAHQKWLRNYWDVQVEAPVDLWRPPNDPLAHSRWPGRLTIHNSPLPRGAPYVDFHWPFRTKVRDFSRVLPVSALEEHVVASCGHWSVASKHSKGKGTLVFLGSPLGPALLAGDAEAHGWLRSIIALPGSSGCGSPNPSASWRNFAVAQLSSLLALGSARV